MTLEFVLICASLGILSVAIFYFFANLLIKNEWILKILSVILFLVIFYAAKTFLIPYYQAFTFEEKIKKNYPIYNLIANIDPNDFNIYISKVKQNILSKGNPNNEIFYAHQLVDSVFEKKILNASNKSIYNFVKIQQQLNQELVKTNPTLLLFKEFPDNFRKLVDLNHLSILISKDLLSAKEAVIRSAIENPQPLLTETEKSTATKLITEILNVMEKQYGTDLVNKTFYRPEDPSLNRAIEAELIVAFYNAVLSKGEENTGLIIKTLVMLKQTAAMKNQSPKKFPIYATWASQLFGKNL